jgi:hypothetical protein
MCKKYNIEIKAGSKLARTLTFTNNDGSPYPLTPYTQIHMQVRRTPSDDPIIDASMAGGHFEISGTSSNILIMSNIDVPDDAIGPYLYDIDFGNGIDILDTLVEGSFVVTFQITQPTA